MERSNCSLLFGADVAVDAVAVDAVAVDALVSVVVVVVVLVSVVVVVLVSAVDVVLALSSTTPDEDLLALQSNGQHQPSEQPLSGKAIASNTPILTSIFIMF